MEERLNLLSELSNDIGRLLSSGDRFDVIIKAGEGQNTKKFFAHALILRERSIYFKTALSEQWAQKENGVIIFTKPNISPETFELLLKYLYTGMVDLENQTEVQVLKLYEAADEFGLRKLNDRIIPYLISKQAEFLRNAPVEILHIVFQYENLEELRNYCLENICENPTALFESPKFASLERELIINLLKCDLEMEEIVIWNYILKWGISRMSTRLDVDNVSQWTLDNFRDLEDILFDLIPHIRWFQIPAKDFWRKISPFELIFPKQLFRDIIGHYLDPGTSPSNVILPSRNSSFESCIIDKHHLSRIASWIDKSEKPCYCSRNIPYLFKLLYRASRDGFEAKKFHELCDNKGSTIMIAKLQADGKLIGGYNPFSWEPYNTVKKCSRSWRSTSDSFLFSFSKENINSGRIMKITPNDKEQSYAVSYDKSSGPAFGRGWDLKITNNKIIRNSSCKTYPNMSLALYHKDNILDDYEVFQVKNLYDN